MHNIESREQFFKEISHCVNMNLKCSMICQWALVCLCTSIGDTGGRLVMQVLFPLYCRVCGVLCSEFKFLYLLYVYFSVPIITPEMFIFVHF